MTEVETYAEMLDPERDAAGKTRIKAAADNFRTLSHKEESMLPLFRGEFQEFWREFGLYQTQAIWAGGDRNQRQLRYTDGGSCLVKWRFPCGQIHIKRFSVQSSIILGSGASQSEDAITISLSIIDRGRLHTFAAFQHARTHSTSCLKQM
jgi:hypothetical protein